MGKSSDDSTVVDRIKSWARAHAYRTNPDPARPALPLSEPRSAAQQKQEHLDGISGAPSRSTTLASSDHNNQTNHSSNGVSSSNKHSAVDASTESAATASQRAAHTKAPGAAPASVATGEEKPLREKPPLPQRAKNGMFRFFRHTKNALTHSWVNVLLVFVPIGIAVEVVGLSPALIFAMNAVAIIPLAGLLTHATETVASRLGDTWGALLNVSFGNAVELIIL